MNPTPQMKTNTHNGGTICRASAATASDRRTPFKVFGSVGRRYSPPFAAIPRTFPTVGLSRWPVR